MYTPPPPRHTLASAGYRVDLRDSIFGKIGKRRLSGFKGFDFWKKKTERGGRVDLRDSILEKKIEKGDRVDLGGGLARAYGHMTATAKTNRSAAFRFWKNQEIANRMD
jgi:hypothetical protein